ncbi:glutaredoxin family protein [Undibacterium sp. Jales W-56]|uniref:glutaredoxin family protein n=1 Tax=Undibacterium sp. Jales W-56 TaxID=2897325 RepID=UPI0021CED592|nr:glutaredoxin family protein [Undibacterium sp. Jales W-56]MCU6432788.1 glutaredoxin family protein [Undibacterium sp. Jales W-56]
MNHHTASTAGSTLKAVFLLASLLMAASVHAQMYKWVGADGKVTYSDVPPPSSVKQVQSKSYGSDTPVSNLPPELAAAAAKNPVTLYTTTNCAPCNEGRAFLKGSGIPFAEKTVKTKEDADKLKQVSGDTQLPLLVISNAKFRGLDTGEWRTALTNAGYPETDQLPKDYRYSAAESAAPAPAPAANNDGSDDNALVKKKRKAQPPPASAESGFRF